MAVDNALVEVPARVLPRCSMAFIIVSKRINTRYFVNKQNPVPGTVVNDVITLPERYVFFLVSQSVRQGTVSPTSYNVILDTMGFPADKIQILTYKMTHLYYNWSGTLRVAAVCQYAHKLAFLVAESIHRAPSAALDRQLYFL
uniref:Piwi domain-containing protein n=1 Tax=Glossina morsitans morsitans TaxID=37546 RepID=A0A1B0G0Z7_GLOMM